MTEDTQMKARVSQNLVLYGGLEAIRLKGTPNVEVENNAVATAAGRVRLVPDGITVDKDTTMTNMTLKGNLVHSYFGEEENKGHAFAMEDTFRPTVGAIMILQLQLLTPSQPVIYSSCHGVLH